MPVPPFDHAISLLVHEEPAVVVDQCRNFEAFAPRSVIMIHVSPTGSVAPEALRLALAAAGCDRSLINPVPVASRWGSILAAHLANVAALAALVAPGGAISFHASNDMLLRELPDLASEGGALFETREVSERSVWFTGRQFARAPAFGELLAALACPAAVGGQIEGSTYPYALCARLAAALEPHAALFDRLPPVAEEIVFPTFALRHLGPPRAAPYVLFRPVLLSGLGALLAPPPLRATTAVDLAQKGLNRVAGLFASPHASAADVEAVLAGRILAVPGWPHAAPAVRQRYHGVKRIARRFDDPLRARIRLHTEARRAAAATAR